ncbi:CotH kinase family protein [uncultured Salinisphaera sp.]|uniref:CotH kinase family protein n=1 Tax=uncultured Salinisphaera sp. TaxID=359372 RepID=UPI0032B2153A
MFERLLSRAYARSLITAAVVASLSACGSGGGGSGSDDGGSSGGGGGNAGGGTTVPDPDFASVRGLTADGVMQDPENAAIYQSPDDSRIIDIYVEIDPPVGDICRGDDPTTPEDEENYDGCTLADLDQDNDGSDAFDPELSGTVRIGSLAAGGDLTFRSDEIEVRGASSREAQQKSYKVEFEDGNWFGMERLQLNKHPYDLSRIRNKLSFDLFKQIENFPSLRTQFVHVYVKEENDADYQDGGLFTNIEYMDDDWADNHGQEEISNIFKAEQFSFQSLEETPELEQDVGSDAFEAVLESKGEDESTETLIAMLNALNDDDVPFDNVLKQYFQADNFRTWLGINILLSNDDTNSQNFYLYRPSQIDNFYFTPWDYDGAWDFFGQPAEQLDFPQRPRWTQGIANWWAMPLVSRYVRNGGIPALEAKLDALQAGALAPANVQTLIDSYPIDEIVQVLINQQGPDLDGLPTVNDGRSAEPQIRQEIERLPGTIAAAREEFDSTLDRPMPVYTAALLENGNVVLRWDESYDIQNKGLRYDVRLATSPVLNGTRSACAEDDDAMPMLNTNVVFSRDGIQGTSVVPTTALTPGQRYYAQVIVRDGDGYCQSSFDEYYDSDEDETYYGVFGFTFTGSEIVTAYDE